MRQEILSRAYDAIGEHTPMLHDCGALCRAACCRPDADGQGGVLIPLESVRGTDLSLDGKQLVFRVADAEGGREKRVPVSIENSLIREKTIRRILDLYLLAVRKDAREAVDGDGPSVL